MFDTNPMKFEELIAQFQRKESDETGQVMHRCSIWPVFPYAAKNR